MNFFCQYELLNFIGIYVLGHEFQVNIHSVRERLGRGKSSEFQTCR